MCFKDQHWSAELEGDDTFFLHINSFFEISTDYSCIKMICMVLVEKIIVNWRRAINSAKLLNNYSSFFYTFMVSPASMLCRLS